MYLLYLDESENSNKNRKSPVELTVFGMSGLLITSRYITNYIDEFHKIKKQNNIPAEWEIHAFEIFSGSGRWSNQFTEEQRRKICSDYSELVVKSSRLKQAFFVYKNSRLLEDDYLESLKSIINKSIDIIGRDGSSTGRQLLIIFDKKDDLERKINQFVINLRDEKNLKNKSCKNCRIIDHGFPGDSALSELLQLSDFVGYVFRLSKTLRRKDSLFAEGHDQRYIKFVDGLVETMSKKVKQMNL